MVEKMDDLRVEETNQCLNKQLHKILNITVGNKPRVPELVASGTHCLGGGRGQTKKKIKTIGLYNPKQHHSPQELNQIQDTCKPFLRFRKLQLTCRTISRF